MRKLLFILLLFVFGCNSQYEPYRLSNDSIRKLYVGMDKDSTLKTINLEPTNIDFSSYSGALQEQYRFEYYGDDGYSHILCVWFINNKVQHFYSY